MGSRRIKIVIVLLVLAAVTAAMILVCSKGFQLDRTRYERIPLTDSNGSPIQVIAVNRSGQMIAAVPAVPVGGSTAIHRIDPDGRAQALPLPPVNPTQSYDINDRGAIVGTCSGPNNFQDAFVWDPQRGFQLIPIRAAFPNANSQAEKINNRGMIVGHWERKQTYSKGVFFYDPNDGIFDIEPLSQIAVSIGGMTEDGMIVGGYNSPFGLHAFLWTRQGGLEDIHSKVTQRAGSRSVAIQENGWILIQAFDKNNEGECVGYHPKFGKDRSYSWDGLVGFAYTIPSADRFAVVGYHPAWKIGRFRIRPGEWNNWIFQVDHKPMLLNPRALSDKRWSIVGMDDQGAIFGNIYGFRNAPANLNMSSEGFLLRPIRPAAPAGK